MTIPIGPWTIPAKASSVEHAVRQIWWAFNEAFRYIPEAEKADPRKLVRRFCDRIVIGEQPPDVYFAPPPKREYPVSGTPDGDRYAWRAHTVRAELAGGYVWETDPDTGEDRRVLRIEGTMESEFVYYAWVNGRAVSGTLDEVWQAQTAET